MSVHAVGELMLNFRWLAVACLTFGLAVKDRTPIDESTV